MISVLMTNFCLGFFRGLSWEEIFADTDSFETAQPPYLKPEPAEAAIRRYAAAVRFSTKSPTLADTWHS